MMRVEYDEVVIVDQLQRPTSSPSLERANGFGVRLEDQWFWFSELEAAPIPSVARGEPPSRFGVGTS